jgi:hypothetical protein
MDTLAWVYFHASAWVVAIILGWSALHKLRFSADFIGAFAGYRLLPNVALKFWFVVPIVEILAVAELLVSLAQSRWLALLLFVLYATAISINLLRGRKHIDCGCGGDGTPISWGLVLRNAALVGLALPLQAPVNGFTAVSGVLMTATVLIAVLCYVTTNQLFANSAR